MAINGAGLKNLSMKLDLIGKEKLSVGWFESAKELDGTPSAYVAAIHEFGSGHIPPRPFIRPTMDKSDKRWEMVYRVASAENMLKSGGNHVAMEALGEAVRGDIQKAIARLQSPPLKAATIAARRRKMADKGVTGNLTKPLVASGAMLAGVEYEIEGGK